MLKFDDDTVTLAWSISGEKASGKGPHVNQTVLRLLMDGMLMKDHRQVLVDRIQELKKLAEDSSSLREFVLRL